MHERFTPLAEWLAPVPEADRAPTDVPSVAQSESPMPPDEFDDVLARVRLFRAALDDAFEVTLGDLLREVALDVVGRELRLAPCEIARIVERARERYRIDEPLGIRVHPADVDRLPGVYRQIAVSDERLRSGDVMLQVRTGTIDASLGTRLERLLRRANS
jgi:flagellar biosynthesis/type III secretory pathway protein FliH